VASLFDGDPLTRLMGRYKTGGLADFTGPAWLDGTKSRPEYVLNAAQTERFFSLVDVLERFNDKDGSTTSKSGDNYFDIEITVEKLENDYDVEQVADKIRRMIYEDSIYRNVNTINSVR
jgi:restriction endonuclease Mrr